MALRKATIWAEMVRRKVQFHKDESWDTIRLWGLFKWGDVSPLLKTGQLLTTYKKENQTIWVWPSKETWEKHIKPLIERHSLSQLLRMAGW